MSDKLPAKRPRTQTTPPSGSIRYNTADFSLEEPSAGRVQGGGGGKSSSSAPMTRTGLAKQLAMPLPPNPTWTRSSERTATRSSSKPDTPKELISPMRSGGVTNSRASSVSLKAQQLPSVPLKAQPHHRRTHTATEEDDEDLEPVIVPTDSEDESEAPPPTRRKEQATPKGGDDFEDSEEEDESVDESSEEEEKPTEYMEEEEAKEEDEAAEDDDDLLDDDLSRKKSSQGSSEDNKSSTPASRRLSSTRQQPDRSGGGSVGGGDENKRSASAGTTESYDILDMIDRRKRRSKLTAEEQALKKAEMASKRRLSMQKQSEDVKNSTIRKILEREGTKKKREEKQAAKDAEKKAAAEANKKLAELCYIDRSSELYCTLSFARNVEAYDILTQTFPGYPSRPSQCAAPGCTNPKTYSCSKTQKPLCSLQCYKKINSAGS
mmetsp:Transcript_27770/g.46626  ORF Transcript_27770/g.46626 Transcript_27770/m.46626 type:complete len:435 (-) Transcript_27770:369-1673(-)|eukprot:CAMPEP_0184358236 /NCGR_PEP_ID=MMETSP1089-20130417/113403_1 /TAXON_ID=38269 ORGANISM="Gloeochaete wittrockiana, Strain SAG46.84" /NCGR_SAMPLE_ID=MMETSP1089 /ASSEMBLY_ACC=CAM_ASM_000445 /LENGTH=434 /DNA_ID=CAMNT_0026696443 /DNA_START=51 /DNA_END=1355 /DNA_ORIENTATION=-